MFSFWSSPCPLITSLQLIKIVYQFLYNNVIGPALKGTVDFKKMGKWAGKIFIFKKALHSRMQDFARRGGAEGGWAFEFNLKIYYGYRIHPSLDSGAQKIIEIFIDYRISNIHLPSQSRHIRNLPSAARIGSQLFPFETIF